MSDLVIGATGHRTLSHPIDKIKEELNKIFVKESPIHVVSGMALGYDTVFVEVALDLGIPFVAALPFIEQAAKWSEKDRNHYMELLEKAKDIYIHPKPPENSNANANNFGYFGRNRWICEQSNLIVAYMINESDGGTSYTWKYGTKIGKKMINLVERL